jgi:repressor LexA
VSAQPAARPALTGRERDALEAITYYIAAHGYPPSMRDIGVELGLSSTATTWDLVDRLRTKGYLVAEPGRPRTLRIIR